MARAAPYAVNWQVKQSPFGVEKEAEAPTDFKRLLRIVRASGYRGYLPIEALSPRSNGGTKGGRKSVAKKECTTKRATTAPVAGCSWCTT